MVSLSYSGPGHYLTQLFDAFSIVFAISFVLEVHAGSRHQGR